MIMEMKLNKNSLLVMVKNFLEIMYEENNPKRILILENNPQKKLYIIFIIVGISSLIAGLIICIL